MHNIGRSYPRRILRLAALGAPIVYLFGAMLCGLWGANGEQVWAQEAGETEYWVEYEGDKYKYLDLSEYWGTGAHSEGEEIILQLGLDETTDFFGKIQIYGGVIPTDNGFDDGTLTYSNYYYDGLCWCYTPTEYFYEINGIDQEYGTPFNLCFCMWSASNLDSQNEMALYTEYFVKVGYGTNIVGYISQDSGQYYQKSNGNFENYGILSINNGYKSAIQFGSGEKARLAQNPTFPDGQPLINYNWHSETYNQNYTDGIFGNFFPRDNFLVKWGENAVGDNPAGFAPFGAFFKYIDNNVTHFKDANQQIGLMAYGYLYYVAHILIADMALLCITFIPKLLDKINDKILGGLDND